jgi:hypothetical protein
VFQAAGEGPSGVDILSGAYSVEVGGIYNARLSSMDHGLAAGHNFYLFTGAGFDSELRTLDENLVEIGYSGDDGPFGAFPNYGSALFGNVNPDGSINFDISGWSDPDFGGSPEAGGSTWHIQDVINTPEVPEVGGQWWAFTGLTPGSAFEAEVLLGTLGDSVMAAWDSAGSLLVQNDDENGLASMVSGVVPADGTVYVSVTGYHGFSGQDGQAYYETGVTSSGDFQVSFVPTPGSLALLGLGGLLAGRRRRRC